MERADQEFRLAKDHYAGMTEGEIRALAAEAYKLTEIGREALEAVIAGKGFKIQLAELDLSIICVLTAMPTQGEPRAFLTQNILLHAWGLITSPTRRISKTALTVE